MELHPLNLKESEISEISGNLLLAVSGGIDSMVLLDVFIKSGVSFAVAHVNFGLRGEESDADESFVSQICRSHDIPLHISRPETLDYAIQNRMSVQMAARELRYNFFETLCKTHKYAKIVTAHNSGDNLENFFIYLLRNNTQAALKGIPAAGRRIFRPLLNSSRSQICGYALANDVKWREDSSNQAIYYMRNKVRNLIIPGLKYFYPEVESDFLQLSNEFSGLTAQKETLWDQNLEQWVQKKRSGNYVPLNIVSDQYNKAALVYFLKKNGFNRSQINQVFEANSGARFIAGIYELNIAADGWHLSGISKKEPERGISVFPEEIPGYFEFGNFEVNLNITPAPVSVHNLRAWMFDAEKLNFPLTLDSWKTGDKMQPWGMRGHRKLSDIFIDRKVSVAQKSLYPVLRSGSEILGLIDVRRSSAAPVTSETQKVLVVNWHES